MAEKEEKLNINPQIYGLLDPRVTVLVSTKVPHIVPHESGGGTINVTEPENGTINGTINAAESALGMINGTIKTADLPRDETRILELISTYPGIQRRELCEKSGISLRSLARLLKKMTSDPQNAQIEHRGSNKTGGWFRRT